MADRVIVDLGCHPHKLHDSLGALVEKYQPDLIYGFDPHPDTDTSITTVGGVTAIVSRRAAWINNGPLRLTLDGTSSRIARQGSKVRCFDFPAWLTRHPCAVVKMDIEGAELPVLEQVVQRGVDDRIGLLLVEWHDRTPAETWHRRRLERKLRCPVEEWWM